MKKLYDLAVATSKYKDRNGNEKSHWENVGFIIENDKGNKFMMLKATFNPAGIERKPGSDSVSIAMFTPKDKNNTGSSRSSSSNPFDEEVIQNSQTQQKRESYEHADEFLNFEDVPF